MGEPPLNGDIPFTTDKLKFFGKHKGTLNNEMEGKGGKCFHKRLCQHRKDVFSVVVPKGKVSTVEKTLRNYSYMYIYDVITVLLYVCIR